MVLFSNKERQGWIDTCFRTDRWQKHVCKTRENLGIDQGAMTPRIAPTDECRHRIEPSSTSWKKVPSTVCPSPPELEIYTDLSTRLRQTLRRKVLIFWCVFQLPRPFFYYIILERVDKVSVHWLDIFNALTNVNFVIFVSLKYFWNRNIYLMNSY